MIRTLLERLTVFARRRYRWVFAGTFVLLALSGWLISRLKLDGDVLNLVPRKDPVIAAYLDTLQEFGTFDYLMVVLEIPEGGAIDPYQAYADRLAARLGEIPELVEVEYRIEEPEKLLEQLFPQAVLFLDAAGREELARRLTPEGIRERVGELRRRLSTPQSLVLRDLARLDPLGIAEVLLGRLQSSRGGMSVDWMSGYFLSQDQRLLLLIAKPSRPPQDIDHGKRMLAAIRQAVTGANADFQTEMGPEPPPLPRVRLGGAHVSAVEDASAIQGDMTLNSSSSMLLVLILFLFAFRRLSTLGYAFVPLAVGMVLTFGFASLVFGTVSSATSGTAALLAGVGVDFVVVLYGRFVEEGRAGKDFDASLLSSMGTAGPAVVAGAFTTAATFYAFTFTDFRGLRQMGVLTGTGILFCLVAVVLLLPAMLAWSEEHHRRRESRPRLYLHSFGGDWVAKVSYRHPVPVLVATAALTVVLGFYALRLPFEDSWKSMRPAGSEGGAVEKLVAERFGSDFDFMMLILRGEKVGPLLDRTEEVVLEAQSLVRDGVIKGISSVTSVIPSPRRQGEALAWLAERRAQGDLDPARVRGDLEAALTAEGFRATAFAKGLSLLERALSPTEPMGVEDLPTEGQAHRLLDRVLHPHGQGWQSVIYLYPPAGEWNREAPPQALALAEKLGPDTVLTGANVINKYMRERVRRDAWIALALGTGLVLLILIYDFRRVVPAIATLVPLALGMVWMLGSMTLLGLPMNFMNIFVTTMIVGLGSDYGIHMVHRYLEKEQERPEKGIAETSNAILIAALTTVVGFGSLATSSFPGMRSTGYVASIGAMTTVVTAMTVLPALIGLRHRRRAKP
ncbi:MAG TPA: MMPL family transporter [Thermoanaerobaculia bacterium]|nr:MMPL family transporter [Thermoanaerobaculia bacterium]